MGVARTNAEQGGGDVFAPITCFLIKNMPDYKEFVPENNLASVLENNLKGYVTNIATAESLVVDHSGMVYTFAGRTIDKTTDEKAFTAWCKSANWFVPIFMGKTETSVQFSTKSGSSIIGTVTVNGTTELNGETYYYTADCPGSMQNPTVTYDEIDRAYIGTFTESSTSSVFKEKVINFMCLVITGVGATLE